MNVNQLVVAAGADLKWLQNSAAIIRRRIRPNHHEARLWALIRLLVTTIELPLKAAYSYAAKALQDERDGVEIVKSEASQVASVVVAQIRFESIFNANLSRALVLVTPSRRGRPKKTRRSAVERAREWGIDIAGLQYALQSSSSVRLEQLSENAESIQELRAAMR
jgi:hypothetical protein